MRDWATWAEEAVRTWVNARMMPTRSEPRTETTRSRGRCLGMTAERGWKVRQSSSLR